MAINNLLEEARKLRVANPKITGKEAAAQVTANSIVNAPIA